jgi:hypothetical protein
MNEELLQNRILGTINCDPHKAKKQIKHSLKLAAGGAYPHVVREMMKEYAYRIINSDASKQEKEDAKLLICYSWWARALERGVLKSQFQQFMLDHLAYLDAQPDANEVMEKWQEYG